MIRRSRAAGLMLLGFAFFASDLFACPFCGPPQSRLSERLAKNEVAVFAEWIDATPAKKATDGATRLRVIERVRGPEGKLEFAANDRITLPREWRAKPGQLCLLFGRKEEELLWETPVEMTDAAARYLRQAPALDAPVSKRLEYFLEHLESNDSLIAMDALAEFAVVPYSDVVALAKKLPREKLRVWLANSKTVPHRLGLYGMMLGLCGTPEDAELLRAKIESTSDEYPFGLDGITFGYLLLTKSEGLDLLDEKKLRIKTTRPIELTAFMSALRVMWTDGGDRIPRERLMQSMRLLLEIPDTVEPAVADLARWQDWSVQDRVMSLYGAEGFEDSQTRKAIVGYLFAASRSKSTEAKLQADRNLDKLRKRDLKMVNEVERFFRGK